MKIKTIVIWVLVIVIFSLGYNTYYQTFVKEKNPEDAIKVYTDIVGSQKVLEKTINKVDIGNKDSYTLFVEKSDVKTADIVFTSDKTMLDKGSYYEMIAYSPFVVLMDQNEDMLKSLESSGLISSKEEMKFNNSDESNINLWSLVTAVREGKTAEIGQSNDFKIYCPKIDTIDGNTLYQLLLKTLNITGSAKGSKEYLECTREIDEFFKMPCVEQVDHIYEMVQECNSLGSDMYLVPKCYYPNDTDENNDLPESVKEVWRAIRKIINQLKPVFLYKKYWFCLPFYIFEIGKLE